MILRDAPSTSSAAPQDERTRITGYAAVFGLVDRVGDVIRAGAFGEPGPVPLLWQHRGAPVGEMLAIGEDARGVWIEADVVDLEVARLVRCGVLRGLSVGYRARMVELIEVSLVAVAMQPRAGVTTVS